MRYSWSREILGDKKEGLNEYSQRGNDNVYLHVNLFFLYNVTKVAIYSVQADMVTIGSDPHSSI